MRDVGGSLTIIDTILGRIEAFEPLVFHSPSMFLLIGIDEAGGTTEELVFGMKLSPDLFDILLGEAGLGEPVEAGERDLVMICGLIEGGLGACIRVCFRRLSSLGVGHRRRHDLAYRTL
jgi:hypothetical protein